MADAHFEQIHLPSTLEDLNLNGCREISEKTLVQISRECPNLKRIELYWNCRITDFGVKKIGQSCPHLEFVNISGCKYIGAAAVTVVGNSCPKLTHLVRRI